MRPATTAERDSSTRVRPAPKSLIYDIYGAYVRSMGGWIAVSDLIELLAQLDVDEQSVRSSVSRLTQKGMLLRRSRDGTAGYELSAQGDALLRQGDRAIFGRSEPADLSDGWVLVVFSIPEVQRSRRHQLRTQLSWLGFGNLGGGVWIAPRRALGDAGAAIRSLGVEAHVDVLTGEYHGFDDVKSLVARCWDLEALGSMYEQFVSLAHPVLRRWRTRQRSDAMAFVDYTNVLHQWRKLPYLDPGLPPELLPREWKGHRAADLFGQIRSLLEAKANTHVDAVMDRRSTTTAVTEAGSSRPGNGTRRREDR